MKIYITKPRSHWLSPYKILAKFYFWKSGYDPYNGETPNWLNSVCYAVQKILDKIHPQINYVKIDSHDTWNTDNTLLTVILPLLRLFKETSNGAPFTDDEDVPDNLKSMNAPRVENEYETDLYFFDRWDYIVNQMIWAFEQLQHEYDLKTCKLSEEDLRQRNEKIKNGLRLFAKYFQNLWT